MAASIAYCITSAHGWPESGSVDHFKSLSCAAAASIAVVGCAHNPVEVRCRWVFLLEPQQKVQIHHLQDQPNPAEEIENRDSA